ncbi:MAG: aldehyde oxidase and xanthine dehydrogenase molybdopterin binding, partial [Enterovirga sp.]|nr:aldehyde oxidase and xanthine dehydrogenase molybdopterin binding [Enterovirga sp.]
MTRTSLFPGQLPFDIADRAGGGTADPAQMKFGIGQPVHRREDPVLVQGLGRYTDDIALPGQVYAAFVRSPYAHGEIRGIDTATAADMPGVLGVYTAADLTGYGDLPNAMSFKSRDGSPMKKPSRGALPADRVRYVGDPVSFVVADTMMAGREAAEAVALDIEPLPALVTAEDAV